LGLTSLAINPLSNHKGLKNIMMFTFNNIGKHVVSRNYLLGLQVIHSPFLSRNGLPVSSLILISFTGYRAGAMRVVNPTAPTVLSVLAARDR
jgi:hypothetical protein